MSALKYWLWLTTRTGMDARGALTVFDCFGSAERAYYEEGREYGQLPIRTGQKEALRDKGMEAPEQILADCERLGIRILTWQDAQYPSRLRQIADPPPVLYVRGRSILFDEEAAIAVVGSRDPSDYGLRCARRLGRELAEGGGVLVSGIAQGIDTAALRGALEGGGTVVSLLAGGIDRPYPPQNGELYDRVAQRGALISEYPPGTGHLAHHFPQRNRIISGLCLGVLAVECAPQSGTMLTVNHALEQDRDVFAVPGPIDDTRSEGTNRLIREGAQLVTCGRDILDQYRSRFPLKLYPPVPRALERNLEQLTHPEGQAPKPTRTLIPREEQKSRFTDDELALLAALGRGDRSAEELVEQTGIPARRVLSALTMLQIAAWVEELPGKRFTALAELEQ